jgi:signal transduction histidine kinase/CheY-like chemotaxis protein/HPt (histidine-containing phosphotransfer) domain-containing protein
VVTNSHEEVGNTPLSLTQLARKLDSPAVQAILAPLAEKRASLQRLGLLVLVAIWVVMWKNGPASLPVMVREANNVYPWVIGTLVVSSLWAVFVRLAPPSWDDRLAELGTVGNFIIVFLLTQAAFILLIPLEAVLPFLAISMGAHYTKRAFALGIVLSFVIVVGSAGVGYWLGRPAYFIYAITLTVGLPIVIGRIVWALRDVSLQAIQARDAEIRFLAAMSHELRTPLNAVINTAQLIDTVPLDPEQARLLASLVANAEALRHRVNEVLDFTAMKSRADVLSETAFAVRTVGRNIEHEHRFAAEKKEIDFSVVVSDSVPPVLHGDFKRLHQALGNLVGNAIKFTPIRGRIELSIESTRDGVGGVTLICRVADSGPGVAPEHRTRIFDEFFQISSGRTRASEGVGLGLAIALKLARLMGGSLHVENGRLGGADFVLQVRLRETDEEVAPEPRLRDLLVAHRASVQPLRILIVDDNESNIAVARRILYEAGHHVQSATNAVDARAELEAHTYDVMLLDVQMPGVSGLDLLESLPSGPARPTVLMLSADTTGEAMRLAAERGADAYLPKPLDAGKLLERLAQRSSQGARGYELEVEVGRTFTSTLADLREYETSDGVGRYLSHVRSGIQKASNELVAAADMADITAFCQAAHALRNEISSVGLEALAERAHSADAAWRAGSDRVQHVETIKAVAAEAVSWVEAQLEFQKQIAA